MSSVFDVRLRVQSGVPVIEVEGAWVPTTSNALADMIQALTNAGHYQIIVNIQRAALEGMVALQALAPLAKMVRAHFGRIDVVGTVEQVEEMARLQEKGSLQFSTSEISALSHIKRTPVRTPGPDTTARVQT